MFSPENKIEKNHPLLGECARACKATFRLFTIMIGFSAAFMQFTNAATIEVARGRHGEALWGVKIEGEIEPGDAAKFLKFYAYFGPERSRTIFLRSKGGDVAESMKIGRLIRALRLSTNVPSHDIPGHLDLLYELEPSDDRNNFICASACFLIYVAGIDRNGDYVVLHRPYFHFEAQKMPTDLEYEKRQKEIDLSVINYLRGMEVDQFYIDQLMATNSQDGYTVSSRDNLLHPLEGMPPSIEEIVLSKCQKPTQQESDDADRAPPNSPTRQRLAAKESAWSDCSADQKSDLRFAAWDRFTDRVAHRKCEAVQLSEEDKVALKTFYAIPPERRSKKEIALSEPLLEKWDAVRTCDSRDKVTLNESISRKAIAKAVPPDDFDFDASVLDDLIR